MDSTEDVWDKVRKNKQPKLKNIERIKCFPTLSIQETLQNYSSLLSSLDSVHKCEISLPHDQVGGASYRKKGVSD